MFVQDEVFPVKSALFSRTVYLRRNEVHLQAKLSEIAEAHQSEHVSIGSCKLQ